MTKKRLAALILGLVMMCAITMGAFAASTTITIKKGQSSVTSGKLTGNYATWKVWNYSSSTETMSAFGCAGRSTKWSCSGIDAGKSATGKWGTSTQKSQFTLQIVGNYYCNGKGTMTVS